MNRERRQPRAPRAGYDRSAKKAQPRKAADEKQPGLEPSATSSDPDSGAAKKTAKKAAKKTAAES